MIGPRFLALLLLSVSASAADDPLLGCYDGYLERSTLQQLSWVGRNLTPWLFSIASVPEIADRQNSAQSLLVRNRPDLWPIGMKATCEAWSTSWGLCGNTLTHGIENSEVDAVRHFLFAARLRQTLGRDTALLILAAHEGNTAQWQEANQMDAYNNLVAIEWTESQLNERKPVDLKSRLAAALEFVRKGKLKVVAPLSKEKCDWNRAQDIQQIKENAKAVRKSAPKFMSQVCRIGT